MSLVEKRPLFPAIIVVVDRVFQGQGVSCEQQGNNYSNYDLNTFFGGRITEP